MLPPEYRGKAVRQLFNITSGNEIPEKEYGKVAQDVINQINFERRNKALKAMDEVMGVIPLPPEIQMVDTPKLQESAAIPTFTSPDDKGFLALPSGAQFIDDSGIIRTKK